MWVVCKTALYVILITKIAILIIIDDDGTSWSSSSKTITNNTNHLSINLNHLDVLHMINFIRVFFTKVYGWYWTSTIGLPHCRRNHHHRGSFQILQKQRQHYKSFNRFGLCRYVRDKPRFGLNGRVNDGIIIIAIFGVWLVIQKLYSNLPILPTISPINSRSLTNTSS